jgi:tellurite resistance protein
MISHHAALIHVMVLVSAADSDMTDSELRTMGDIVRHLPVFSDFDESSVAEVARDCAALLAQSDGLEQAMAQIEQALPENLRETAYAIACDIAAADGKASQEELRLLQMLRHRLKIERLAAAAIERGARARYARA